MKDLVRRSLFSEKSINWSKKEDGYEKTRQVTDEMGDPRIFSNPNSDAMLLMAKYYELKYGVKIIVVTAPQDLEMIKNLVDESEKSQMSCKFAFVLPNFAPKKGRNGALDLIDTGWSAKEPFNNLDERLIYDQGHVCPVVYEKLPDGRSSIIAFDSVGSRADGWSGHSEIIEKIAGGKTPIYTNGVILQNSDVGCRSLSILMLKDALRMPNIIDKLGLKKPLYLTQRFDILPEELLKYLQTGSPWKSINRSAEVMRSSSQKPSKSFEEYSNQNRTELYWSKDFVGEVDGENSSRIESSIENTKLLRENEFMVDRIARLLEFYKVDHEENSIKNFAEEMKRTQEKFPVQLPKELPDWSHALEWSSVENQSTKNSLANYSAQTRADYQYFCFVANNLHSQHKPLRDRACLIFDPFTTNVGKVCFSLIEKYENNLRGVFRSVVLSMDDNPEKQQKFITAISEELKTEITLDDFTYKNSDKLKKSLKSLDLNQAADPIKDLILRCGIEDNYPGTIEEQAEVLKKILDKKIREEDSLFIVNHFVASINKDLSKEEHLALEDFKAPKIDKLEKAILSLKLELIWDLEKYDSMQEFVYPSVYNRFYPYKMYQEEASQNEHLTANLDSELYQKIVTNKGVGLTEKEAEEVVQVLNRNKNGTRLAFANEKEKRAIFGEIIVSCGMARECEIGLVDLNYGLIGFAKGRLKSCQEIVDHSQNLAVQKMFLDGEIISLTKLLEIAGPSSVPSAISSEKTNGQQENGVLPPT